MFESILSTGCDGIKLNTDQFLQLLKAVKPNLTTSIIVAILPAYISAFATWYLYIKKKNDDKREKKLEQDNKKIKGINLLISNLLQCVEDQIENRKYFEEEYQLDWMQYKAKKVHYAIRKNCNIQLISDIKDFLIADLPEVCYELNTLKNKLSWLEKYHNYKGTAFSKELYITCVEKEAKTFNDILYCIIPIILILYDYGTTQFPKKRILKISAKPCMTEIWDYLPDITAPEIFIASKYQYTFKNLAIMYWFFTKLKRRQRRRKKQEQKHD